MSWPHEVRSTGVTTKRVTYVVLQERIDKDEYESVWVAIDQIAAFRRWSFGLIQVILNSGHTIQTVHNAEDFMDLLKAAQRVTE